MSCLIVIKQIGENNLVGENIEIIMKCKFTFIHCGSVDFETLRGLSAPTTSEIVLDSNVKY